MQNAEHSEDSTVLKILVIKSISNIHSFLPDNILNYFIYTFSFNLYNYCWKVIKTGLGDWENTVSSVFLDLWQHAAFCDFLYIT